MQTATITSPPDRPLHRRTVQPNPKPLSVEALAGLIREVERGQRWIVPSRTRSHVEYVVERSLDGSSLLCGCEAGRRGQKCCHKDAIQIYHTAQLIANHDRLDEEFAEMDRQEADRKAREMADRCAVPVVDPDDSDPWAETETIVLTDAEAEALQPVKPRRSSRCFALFTPPPAVPAPDWLREQEYRAGRFA